MTDYLPKHTQIVPEFNSLLFKAFYLMLALYGVSSSLVTMTNDSGQRETDRAMASRSICSPVKLFGGVKTPSPGIKIRRPIATQIAHETYPHNTFISLIAFSMWNPPSSFRFAPMLFYWHFIQ
ncbi:hypothetical protein RYZ59_06840 [Citrobacter sp. HN-141]|nr:MULTISPECIES: hypothetical protein [unclassified Citrobacter]MDW2643304.1 hypothetical protein [Citrobacter sp. HN-141]MDW2652651.1 hypothetical protein [Citrobacter sp. HN-120]MDW2695676.1 hypothetical protein [Citrobacter sp. HN-144]